MCIWRTLYLEVVKSCNAYHVYIPIFALQQSMARVISSQFFAHRTWVYNNAWSVSYLEEFVCEDRTWLHNMHDMVVFPVKNSLRDNMSITMHGSSIFSNPVYISLYFPPSSNKDISMLFLALSYSYSEQCWSYINNACPFWYDTVSLQLLPFVITPPLPKTGKHNWFLAWSDDGKRLMIIRTHESEKLYCKNPLYTSTV